MKYSSSYFGVNGLIFLVALLILGPLIISSNIILLISIYLFSSILFYFFVLKKLYKVYIHDNALHQIFLIGNKKKQYIIDKTHIEKVKFGFPATNGHPAITIFFKAPSIKISFTCSDRKILKQFYSYFKENDVMCTVYPEHSINQLKH